MSKNDRITIMKQLESDLNYRRFIHTLGVAGTATSLAMCYGVDPKPAELAGLLHDCAKNLDLKKMQKICEKGNYKVSEKEENSVSLLHSKAGSVLAQEKFGVQDEDILNAIRFHTTGRPGMSLLEKIIFVADYIEPGRDTAPNLSEIRKMAFGNIDEAVLKILYDTLVYLNSTGAQIDEMTQKTYDYYKQIYEEKNIYD